MTLSERRSALKKLTRYQVFWDLKDLVKDKPKSYSKEQLKYIYAINSYRLEKHLKKYLSDNGMCYRMYTVGNYRDPPIYDYSFIGPRIREGLPVLNLY